jgi:hypothetical protein
MESRWHASDEMKREVVEIWVRLQIAMGDEKSVQLEPEPWYEKILYDLEQVPKHMSAGKRAYAFLDDFDNKWYVLEEEVFGIINSMGRGVFVWRPDFDIRNEKRPHLILCWNSQASVDLRIR